VWLLLLLLWLLLLSLSLLLSSLSSLSLLLSSLSLLLSCYCRRYCRCYCRRCDFVCVCLSWALETSHFPPFPPHIDFLIQTCGLKSGLAKGTNASAVHVTGVSARRCRVRHCTVTFSFLFLEYSRCGRMALHGVCVCVCVCVCVLQTCSTSDERCACLLHRYDVSRAMRLVVIDDPHHT